MSSTDAVELASSTLGTFQEIESRAGTKLAGRGSDATAALASINTFNTTAAVDQMASITDGETKSLIYLIREPAVSRILVESEDGEVDAYYICRTASIPLGGAKLASYRTDFGRLASHEVGDEVDVQVGNRRVWFRVLDKLDLKPEKTGSEWDSLDNIWRREFGAPQTIPSLRKLIEPSEQDDFEAMLAGESEAEAVKAGLRHQIRNAMALRDQAILDKIQDEIFRLSIDHQLIILGPPGTGKTTTLIKRLGQKLDWEALSDDEQALMAPYQGRSRWIMFTPSELLKHYVREAFSREGVPASTDHIKTWDTRRHELARTVFGILRTNTGGMFILKEDRHHCPSEVIDDPRSWFDDFKSFHERRILEALMEGASLLRDSSPDSAQHLVKQLVEAVAALSPDKLLGAYAAWNGLEERIEPILKSSRKKTDDLIRGQGNLLYNKNNAVFAELAAFLDSLGLNEDEEEDGAQFDDDSGEEAAQPSHSERQKAYQAYQRFLQSYARSRYRGASLGKGSRAARIRDWLGERVPSDDWMKELGGEMTFQNALRRFRNAWKRYVLDVPASYRAFRRECLANEQYGYQRPDIQAHIDVTELDAILLLMLRSARELIKQDFVRRNLDQPKFTELARISNQFLQQVLVDEATDFSVLQLACMESLTDPATQSFFACGDFNQRITGDGIRRLDQLEWISSNLKPRRINTVYRQSRLLNTFASQLLELMDGDREAIGSLPDHSTHDGVMPVLAEGLDGTAVAEWLAERISEIEQMVNDSPNAMPSIAVLVGSEEHVKPMAQTLTEKLEHINLRAVACVDGQTLGNESDVRVFDIQHIKGLEFEAVFFVGVDALATTRPELFERFLYVGATRAATYLGIVCHRTLPISLESLRPNFSGNW